MKRAPRATLARVDATELVICQKMVRKPLLDAGLRNFINTFAKRLDFALAFFFSI